MSQHIAVFQATPICSVGNCWNMDIRTRNKKTITIFQYISCTQKSYGILQILYNDLFGLMVSLSCHCSTSGIFVDVHTDDFLCYRVTSRNRRVSGSFKSSTSFCGKAGQCCEVLYFFSLSFYYVIKGFLFTKNLWTIELSKNKIFYFIYF